jgi:hypothetical protein
MVPKQTIVQKFKQIIFPEHEFAKNVIDLHLGTSVYKKNCLFNVEMENDPLSKFGEKILTLKF